MTGVRAVLLLAGLLLVAGPAAAQPVFDAADVTVVQQRLERAAAAQDACYGWTVSLTDPTGPSGVQQGGAPGGLGAVPDLARCRAWALLEITITFVPETSDAADRATIRVDSSAGALPPPAGATEAALLSDRGDEFALAAIDALPGLLAQTGQAPFLPPATSPTAPADDPLGAAAGSDFLRERGGLVALLGLGVVGGLAWAGIEFVRGSDVVRSLTDRYGLTRARHPVELLQPGDVVAVDGTEWLLRGTLAYEEDGYRWAEHLLDDTAGTRRWLSVDASEGLDVALWETVPLAAVTGEPGAGQLVIGGTGYLRTERGRARFTATGTTGTPASGTCDYADYRAISGPGLAAAEHYGGGWEVSVGRTANPHDIVVIPAPQQE